MDKILEIALNAEQKAQHIMETAQRIKDDCERSIENADKIKGEYLNKSKAAVAIFYDEKLKETEAEEERIYHGLADALSAMDAKYAAEGEAWVDKMFKDITTL